MRALIESCTGSRGAVQEIVVRVPPSFRFVAGQYLEVMLNDELGIPLSIASAPHRLPELHLHYRSTPGMTEAELLDERLARADDLTIRGPFGTVCLATPITRPLLIAAGGTGGAQALGLLDALLAEPPSQPVIVLWCADRADDLYRSGWLESLEHGWFTSKCIVDASRTAANRALRWLRDEAPRLTHHDIILSGSPTFVYAAADTLQSAGVSPEQMAADVFTYAPRKVSAPNQPSDTA